MNDGIFTLADFLKMYGAGAKLLSAQDADPAAAVIRHISVNEAPAGDFIRENELVLTTAIGCRAPGDMLAFFRVLRENGAVAVAVTFEDADSSAVHQCVLDYAKSAGLHIVWLPWSYRFADIVERVLDRIRFAYDASLNEWAEFRRVLIDRYFSAMSIESAARLLSDKIGSRIVLTDASGAVLCDTGGTLAPYEKLDPKRESLTVLSRISAQNRDLGTIYAHGGDILDAEDTAGAAAFFSMPFQLWLERYEAPQSARAIKTEEFLRELVETGLGGSADMRSRARFAGLSVNGEYACLVGMLRPEGRPVKEWLGDNSGKLGSLLPFLWPGGLAAVKDDSIIALTMNFEEAGTLALKLSERLRARLPELGVFWGLSERGSVSGITDMYGSARLAASLCRLDGDARKVFRARDADVYLLLRGGLSSPEAKNVRQRRAGALMAYDKEKGTDLVSAFMQYVNTNCNACETARRMHLHRQSLRYRLDKIQEIAGISLDDHDDLTALELCIKAADYERLSNVDP